MFESRGVCFVKFFATYFKSICSSLISTQLSISTKGAKPLDSIKRVGNLCFRSIRLKSKSNLEIYDAIMGRKTAQEDGCLHPVLHEYLRDLSLGLRLETFC